MATATNVMLIGGTSRWLPALAWYFLHRSQNDHPLRADARVAPALSNSHLGLTIDGEL